MKENEEYNYKNSPAYRRKLKREKQRQAEKAAMLSGQGPITMLIVYILDFVIYFVKRFLEILLDFGSIGFRGTFDTFYGTYEGIIPNSEKFGTMVNMKPMRYIITILAPPVGVFISKGLYSWFNILLCFLLTYIHLLLGIVYALVITHKNRYADRYEAMEYKRLTMIRQVIRSCLNRGDDIVQMNESLSSFLYSILFLAAFFLLLFYAFKFM